MLGNRVISICDGGIVCPFHSVSYASPVCLMIYIFIVSTNILRKTYGAGNNIYDGGMVCTF